MRIACTTINNNGVSLKKSLINESLFKYNGVFGRALFKLYDLGYQNSPSVFDLTDFRSALLSDFPDEISLLRNNLAGKIELDNEDIIKYAMLKTTNAEFKNLLSIYHDVLVSKNALKAFDTLLSHIKLPKKSDIVKVKSRLGVSGSVHNFNSLPLDCIPVQECFNLNDNETLVRYNTADIMVKAILLRLGYSLDEYISHKESGEPFFISGVSQEDELSLLSIIISGKVVADGKFGKELMDDVNKYYEDFYKTHDAHIHCLNYEEVIFNASLDERISLINEKRKSFTANFREFYVTTNEIIFVVEKDDIISSSTSYFKDNKLHLGAVTVSHENRCEFSKINTLCGLCGEFIHESVVKEKGLIAKGLPVSIKFGLVIGKRFKLSSLNYYPIYNVYYSDESSNIVPLLGNDIHIIMSDIETIFQKFGVSCKAELFDYILKATDVDLPSSDISRVEYEKLVSDLTTALIYAECGILDYDMYGSNYTWVTDDIFYRACIEAENLFKGFGF